jgi:2-amino-4-hydroxy-6-hydroxymethyldihydropteridine diphosphokinase
MTAPSTDPVVIGLGSNIRPETHIPEAFAALRTHVTIRKASSVYKSPAVGLPPGSADFLNVAVELAWSGTVFELKSALVEIEQALGRQHMPSGSWASRTIDMDILIRGDLEGSFEACAIPHPDIERFAHTAVPLAELVGDRVHPRLGVTYADIADGLDSAALLRVGSLVDGAVP